MPQGTPQTVPLVDYAFAALTLPGEPESGDRHIVVPTRTGTLVAVVDGLGHGAEAAEAAKVAVATLERYAGEPIISLMKRCHKEMQGTRGAVMSLAAFYAQDETVTWLTVGNVEGILLRADPQANPQRENILMRSGVVGFRLPALRASVMTVSSGDVLIFATDGIASGFDNDLTLNAPLQHIADSICTRHSKGTDDALVLVARYLGDGS
ncbi:MAG: SpoIIE family protein phosphatase [Acidobacteria bacterium]|nr:SpoIIE family protein phosphatase [Acidobacteriota bacterium]